MIQLKTVNNRNLSLDILKILSMVMVIILHTNTYGLKGLTFEITDKFYWITQFLHTFSLVAVNCFVLISGYFMSKSTLSAAKLAKLWGLVAIFSLGTYCALCIIPSTGISFSYYELIAHIFPVISNRYWFFTCYVVMTVLSPFINKFIDSLTKKSFQKLLLVLIVLFVAVPSVNIFGDPFGTANDYSPLWFIILYFTGAYIRRYPLPKLPYGAFYIAIIIISVISCAVLSLFNQHLNLFGDLAKAFSRYNSAPVFFGSVFLFLFFLNHPIKLSNICGRFISGISAASFGVYLLHEHPMLRDFLWNDIIRLKDTTSNVWEYSVRLVISIAVIFVAGVVAGFVITKIINVIEKLITKIIRKK